MNTLDNISSDDIDFLLTECHKEIGKIKGELGVLLIKQDMLRRKKKQWEEEKDVLECLKSGMDFQEFLVKIPPKTMKTLNTHYTKAMDRYNEMFPEKK